MSFLFISKTIRLNNLKTRTAINSKISVFLICVEVIMYLLLYDLHDCIFKLVQKWLRWIFWPLWIGICRSDNHNSPVASVMQIIVSLLITWSLLTYKFISIDFIYLVQCYMIFQATGLFWLTKVNQWFVTLDTSQ